MNKNPFLPTPSFTPQQPPLPPGPPPTQAGQPDYSAWWPGAQAHQPHVQPPAVGAYNPQWTSPQPPRPPAEQSALYANYGYGSQTNWQRQQQQQQPAYHPPPIIQQPPPPSQSGYNPYQPTGVYAQPYVPQPGPPPQPMVQPGYPHPSAQPQQIFAPQIAPHQPPHQQPTQPRHHASPQNLPPAKRQRFDGPNNHNRHHHSQHHQPPPQPQFQPPPAPPHNIGNFSGPNRSGLPSGPGNRGGIPSGPGGRGGGASGRGGRGGSMTGNRGGLSGGRGRGGSFVAGGGGRPTGPGGNQPHGPARGQGSRNFGNKDFHNRRGGGGGGGGGGGSFNAGSGNAGYSHQGPSFRGRNQGHAGSNRGSRNDGGSGTLGSQSTMSSSFGGKKDENRRTLTDFKIVGLSIPDLGWTWGTIPSSSPVKTEETGNNANESVPSVIPVKKEALEEDKSSLLANPEPEKGSAEFKTEPAQDVPSTEAEIADVKPAPDANANPPPSRIRIYFHTPVTADDSRPIPHNASYGEVSSDTRKGKRKKTEDDDGDVDERRAPPPPPQMGISNDDRSSVAASVAPSVAETASEADWLMAAIVEGEEEAEAANALQSVEEDDQDAPHDHDAEHDMAEGGDDDAPHDVDETLFDGTSHDDDMTIVEGAEPDAFGSTVDVGDASAPASVAQELPLNGVGPTTVDGEHKTSPNGTLAEEQPVGDAECPQDASVSVAAPSSQSDALPFEPAANGSANLTVPVETQALQYSSQQSQTRSLQSISNQPTLLDVETQESTQPDRDQGDSTQIIQPEHLPEPPASPSTIAHEDSSSGPATKTDSKADKTPSANRLSISYARGNRRLVIDAEVVDYLKLYRQEGRIEVAIKITRDKQDTIKGVLMEGLSEVTKSYSPLLDAKDGSLESDPTVPPFWRTTIPSTVHLLVYLDTARPLSEPKWAKTGDVQDWLKSMFGRMFWVAGDAAEGWEKKIQVTDPDPPPTIWTVLDGWVANSPVGQLNERQRFLKTHMTDVDNILEILLRLVRGERATPFSQSTPTISAPSVSGPLLSAFQGSSHGAQQTHVSLAVLAMFRLTTEYATKASGDKGKVEAEERVGEIIRYLPSHLIYKSLDGIFKEWRVEKKGR